MDFNRFLTPLKIPNNKVCRRGKQNVTLSSKTWTVQRNVYQLRQCEKWTLIDPKAV